MLTSKNKKLLHYGFGIKNVILKSFHFLGNSIIFKCHISEKLKRCSKCHSKNVRIKQTKTRQLRMVPMGSKSCILEIRVHKFHCRCCDSSTWVDLPFAVGKLPMTQSFVTYILSLVKITTIKSISKLLRLQWKTVKNIHKDYLKKHYAEVSYKDIAYLSMDEFSIRKGHTYMTIFLDLTTGRIIHAIQGRSVEEIKPFIETLSKKALNLKAIAMDMSRSYISAVKQCLPNVVYVFDRFHVMKLMNEALDQLRKAEHAKYEKQGCPIIKGDRFLLLRNLSTLTSDEQGRLEKLFEINSTLSKAHLMKEQLREFWNQGTLEEGARFLVHWIHDAKMSGIKVMERMGNTLLSHYEGLLNYYKHRLSNGKIEGTNNKIKVLKRVAYGYRDMGYFELLLLDLHEKSLQLVA